MGTEGHCRRGFRGLGLVLLSAAGRRRRGDDAAEEVSVEIRNEFGFVLYFPGGGEFVEGFVIGALGLGGEAGEGRQSVATGFFELPDDARVGIVGVRLIEDDKVEGEGFEAAGSGELPAGDGHLFNQELLMGAGGAVLRVEGGKQVVEFRLGLVGEDGEGGHGVLLMGFGPGLRRPGGSVRCGSTLSTFIGACGVKGLRAMLLILPGSLLVNGFWGHTHSNYLTASVTLRSVSSGVSPLSVATGMNGNERRVTAVRSVLRAIAGALSGAVPVNSWLVSDLAPQ